MKSKISAALNFLIKNPKFIFLNFGIVVLFSFIPAGLFFKTLLAELNGSTALDTLFQKFDFLPFADFVYQHAKAFSKTFILLISLGALFIIFNIFISGGNFTTFVEQQFSFGTYFQNCKKYFLPFLLLSLLFGFSMMLLIILDVLILKSIISFIHNGNEKDYSILFIIFFVLVFLQWIFINTAQLYAKSIKVQNDAISIFGSFSESISMVFKNPSFIIVFLLLFGLGIFCLILNYFIADWIGLQTFFKFILLFIFQQILVLIRVILNLTNIGVAANTRIEIAHYTNNPQI